jgi:hypothetical protein
MSSSSKRPAAAARPDEQQLREQEVLRANRELAAYFKGARTEREARAALKIIKAFIRDRERIDPAKRRPLPGAQSSVHATDARKRSVAGARKPPRRRIRAEVKPLAIAEAKSDAPQSDEPSSTDE